ncbi:MAG: hypothetical protein WCP40_00040 [Opitutae bacterium]
MTSVLYIGLAIVILTIVFAYWRTPWSRVWLSPSVTKQWREHDLNLKHGLPEPILEATFEGCKIKQQSDRFHFEVNGSKPIELTLANPSSHWLRSHNVPEMLAMYGLQYAACCLKQFAETSDKRWLNKFDRALEIAELEARRGLKNTFFPWTEHASALRMTSSRYCLYTLSQCIEKDGSNDHMDDRYRRVLKIHLTASQLSMQPLLYDYITNHGLITDSALLQCAITWPGDYPLTKKVLKTVSQRAEKAAVYFVSADGVPLEPATSYWYLIRRLLNDIKSGLQLKNIKPSEVFLSRLRALDSFLTNTNMDGAVQRFGDSACGHEINLPFIAPTRQDETRLWVYDTGLILMNVVQGGRVVMQFMVNAQDISPRVHAQSDSGALALYARGIFWINSPGSYTAMNLAKRKVYTHYTNQSGVWSNLDHRNGCRVLSVKTENDNFVITLAIGTSIERSILISRKGVNIQIIDSTKDKSDLTVGLLLPPSCLIKNEGNRFTLMLNGKELPVVSDTSIVESKGYISYRRNEVIETKSLRRSAPTVHTQIHLPEFDNQVTLLTALSPCSIPYIRKFGLVGGLAQCIRSISVRKVQLLLLASVIFITLSFVTKIFNQ